MPVFVETTWGCCSAVQASEAGLFYARPERVEAGGELPPSRRMTSPPVGDDRPALWLRRTQQPTRAGRDERLAFAAGRLRGNSGDQSPLRSVFIALSPRPRGIPDTHHQHSRCLGLHNLRHYSICRAPATLPNPLTTGHAQGWRRRQRVSDPLATAELHS
jgi:hypothetical protein